MQEHIIAEVSAEYLGQAESLLHEQMGESGQYGRHVPAAVISGSVLEDGLRRLCARQSPEIDTKKQNGQPKRLNALIDDLQNAKLYNSMKGDRLRSWAKTRNHAAHGEFSEFNRQDVDAMISGVKNFLADYL